MKKVLFGEIERTPTVLLVFMDDLKGTVQKLQGRSTVGGPLTARS